MKLYEIAESRRRLLDEVLEADGEITDEQAAALDAIGASLDDKVQACAMRYREMVSEAEAVKGESDRMTKRARTIKARAEWLRGYVQRQMDMAGVRKVEGQVPVTLTAGSIRLVVDDEAAIPGQYRIPQPDKVDKVALKAAIKVAGEEGIRGAHVEQVPGIRIG